MQFKLTPILPRPLNVSGLKQALIDGMRDVGQRIREDFEDTTKTWNHQPKFDPPFPIPRVALDEITVTTETEDQVYGWLDQGTKKNYPIPRVPGVKSLAFPSQFIAKTSPGIIGSGVGFSGGDTVFRKQIIHPGVEARNFDETIAKNNKSNFKITMEQAMSIAARGSGHRL